MNIYELSKEIPLLDETIEAVEKAVTLTGKPISFCLVDKLLAHAILKAARDFMDEHIIYLRKDKIQFINHLIVHECHHLYRFWSVEKSERKALSHNINALQQQTVKWKKEIGKKSERYPAEIYTIWNNGLHTLLYNAVTDTRIEQQIYLNFPSIREEQYKSLKALEDEARKSLDKQIEATIPSSLFQQVGAMNYVFLKQLESIVGRNWKKSYKGHSDIINLGNRLLRMVPSQDEGLLQDIDIINNWSTVLKIDDIMERF